MRAKLTILFVVSYWVDFRILPDPGNKIHNSLNDDMALVCLVLSFIHGIEVY